MDLVGKAWSDIVATYNPHLIEFGGNIIVQVIFWWIPCIAFSSLHSIFPGFSEAHKIQPAPKQPTANDIHQSVIVALRNQFMVTALHGALVYAAYTQGMPPTLRVTVELPSILELARDYVFCLLGREAMFYYSHRVFHWRPLYKRIHKMHHKFTAPVAFASQYAHPVEHIIANMLPIALPPLILRVHVVTMFIFLASMLIETSTVHSGYDFLGGVARKHDRHHERFDVYFGGIGVLDWLHGTGEDEKRRKRA